MDRLTSMITFVNVVDAGGFAAAARSIGLSPSSVTTQIQALEGRLGVRLLNRSTRSVSLTEGGRLYYDRCLHVLAEADNADNVVKSFVSSPRGQLHLYASPETPVLLAPTLAEFASLYPDVKLILKVTDRLKDFVDGGIDLAVGTFQIPNSNLIKRRVGSFRLLVCGSPDYFVNHGIPHDLHDLFHHNCLTYSFSGSALRWRFGAHSLRLAGNVEADSIEALKLAAVLGQGLVQIPDFLVVKEISSGALVPTLMEFCDQEQAIDAVYACRHYLPANVRCLLELVLKRFKGANEKLLRTEDIDPESAYSC